MESELIHSTIHAEQSSSQGLKKKKKKKKGKGMRADLRLLAVLQMAVETIGRWFQATMKQPIIVVVFSFCAEALFSSLFFKIVAAQPAKGRRWREADNEVVDGALRWRCCIQRRRERPKEKEVIVLLFSSVFLFFCSFPMLKSSLLYSFPLLRYSFLYSFLFSAPLVSNRRPPLFFFPTVKMPFGSLCFFSSTFTLFFFCFSFFSLLFSSILPPPIPLFLSYL